MFAVFAVFAGLLSADFEDLDAITLASQSNHEVLVAHPARLHCMFGLFSVNHSSFCPAFRPEPGPSRRKLGRLQGNVTRVVSAPGCPKEPSDP